MRSVFASAPHPELASLSTERHAMLRFCALLDVVTKCHCFRVVKIVNLKNT